MFEYETYIKEKWMEGHGLRQDEIYLREAYRRAKIEQRREASSGESIMKHLKDVNLSWFRHCKFAWSLSWKLFLLSLSGLVHGLLPFIFISTVSNGVKKLHNHLNTEE